MEYCLKCGETMEFHISYFHGTPVIYYTCPCCGNDTRKYICTATAVSQLNKTNSTKVSQGFNQDLTKRELGYVSAERI